MSILIKNAVVVKNSIEQLQGDILIQENRISAIGKDIKEKTDRVLDASGKIAIPGLVNAHTHVSMTALRGHGEDLPLQRWLEEKIRPLEGRQTEKDAGASALLSFCEMIRSGTTAFADMSAFDPSIITCAAAKAGMRGIVAMGVADFDDPDKRKEMIAGLDGWSSGGNELARPSVAAHAIYTCSEELLLHCKKVARKKGLKFHMHVSETRKEIFDVLKKHGRYPFEYLDSIGLVDSDSIFVHGGWLTKREIALAGKKNLSVAGCPVSNLKLATGGIAQLVELDAAGANVCLGTDSAASNNSLDMFETMKMAALLQKHHYWKADALPAGRTFDFATINGAKALGFDAGCIEVGKLADIVLLERGPNLCPGQNIIADLVYAAGPQNVSDVIIDGKVVLQNRRILIADEKQVIERAAAAAEGLVRR